jgi:hypothetical protein
MVICFAGHGVVNKKRKRIKIKVIKKKCLFILPPFFEIYSCPYLKSGAIQEGITLQGNLSEDYGRKCCAFGMDGKSSTTRKNCSL